ncbi:2-isopropylmalate synthase [Kitasatospora sp. NPDC059571]|uniref:2-isopropylmalate synthase n=1 Tax=Kitasatospora sp. NPDC059571 TaxID=3346871 RepID=UPI00369598A1
MVGNAAVDVVRESARAGRLVMWEESARDGAQAKTLMSAEFRVRLAREQGRIFGGHGPRHVVFAAGFPAVCAEEYEAVRRVAVEAEGAVSVAAVCRGTADDLRRAVTAVRGTAHARVMVVVPASEAMAQVMVHRGAREALDEGVALVKRARDLDEAVAVDVCLADAARADHGLASAAAEELTAAGAGTVLLADTVGGQLPTETAAMFAEVRARTGPEVVLGAHLHNDLGLGLANTLEAVRAGVRVVAGSWLGLAERSGMAATEQLLFLLAHDPGRIARLIGAAVDGDRESGPGSRRDGDPGGGGLWWTEPDLTRLPVIARMVSAQTELPLTVTTPIVGTGVGTISTGTPFVHPELFQPFDPQARLGIAPTVVLTHLASARVVTAVAARLGRDLDAGQARTAMGWVKTQAYRTGRAVVDEQAFAAYLDGLTAVIAAPNSAARGTR